MKFYNTLYSTLLILLLSFATAVKADDFFNITSTKNKINNSSNFSISKISNSSCSNAGIASIMNFCFDSVFPIRIMGKDIIKGRDVPAPAGATRKPACMCQIGPIPKYGITTGRWIPTRMVEVVRSPGCSPIFGPAVGEILKQISKITNPKFIIGGEAMLPHQSGFRHYHNWAFPLYFIYGVPKCFYLGPLLETSVTSFTWSKKDKVWMNLLYPEWVAISSITNNSLFDYAAHSASCIANTTGKGTSIDDKAYWLGGCMDNSLPAAGSYSSAKNSVIATSTILNRAIMASNRTKLRGFVGLSKGFASVSTCGDKALCGPVAVPYPHKSEFKATMLFPYSEAHSAKGKSNAQNILKLSGQVADFLSVTSRCAHRLGSSEITWGLGRNTQAFNMNDSDAVYLIWRWVDCCVF